VTLIVDIRSGSDTGRHQFVETLKAEIRVLAERRHLGLLMTETRNVATTRCDPALQESMAAAIKAVGGEPLKLASGAGPDGTAMAKLCPIAMMFVRCRGGVSHNPAEYASPADMGLAVAALIRFIETVKL
jgi:allantoate deiminase